MHCDAFDEGASVCSTRRRDTLISLGIDNCRFRAEESAGRVVPANSAWGPLVAELTLGVRCSRDSPQFSFVRSQPIAPEAINRESVAMMGRHWYDAFHVQDQQ